MSSTIHIRSHLAHRLLATTGTFAAAALLVTACSSSPSTDIPATGGSPSAGASGGSTSAPAKTYDILALNTDTFMSLPYKIAADDILPDWGVHVTISAVTGGGTISTEFQGGVGTIALTDAAAALRLQQQGAIPGGVTIMGVNISNLDYAITAPADSPLVGAGMAALKGKKVAITSAGALSDYSVAWGFKVLAKGMSKDDAEVVPLGPAPTILQAVQNKQVDAGLLYDPALASGLTDGTIGIVQDLRQYPFATGVLVGRTDEIAADPTPYMLFRKAQEQAIEHLASDPAWALEKARKYYGEGQTDETLKEELKSSLEYYWHPEFSEQLYNDSKSFLIESGEMSADGFPTYQEITKNRDLTNPK